MTGPESWYNHLPIEELLPLLAENERRIDSAIGLLEAATVAKLAIESIIKSRIV